MLAAVITLVALSSCAIAGPAADGCSSRGGPGYRLANGKCVSWAQHEKHTTIGDFPVGAACEHPDGCSLQTKAGLKRLQRGEIKVGQ